MSGYHVNYAHIMSTVAQTLQMYNRSFPVDLFAMVKRVPNLGLYQYSDLARESHISLAEVCNRARSKYAVYICNTETNQHIIYFNDTLGNDPLLRFTMAHELAHFFLVHSEKTQKNLSYKYVEQEANFFARNLLSPVWVVDNLLTDFEPKAANINKLAKYLGITYEAAKIRLRSYKKDRQYHFAL